MQCSVPEYIELVLMNNPEDVLENMRLYGVPVSISQPLDANSVKRLLYREVQTRPDASTFLSDVLTVEVKPNRYGADQLMRIEQVGDGGYDVSIPQVSSEPYEHPAPILKLPEFKTTINWQNTFYAFGTVFFLIGSLYLVVKLLFKR